MNCKCEELEIVSECYIKELEKVVNLSEVEVREQLFEVVKVKVEIDVMALVKNFVEQVKIIVNKEVKKIIIQFIQCMCVEYMIENIVLVFNFDFDDLKGQIIGWEGWNIWVLEVVIGVEIVVDDMLEVIVIFSFDFICWEVVCLVFKCFVVDGCIYLVCIEEVVVKVCKQFDEQIVEIGECIVIDLDFYGFDFYFVKMVGCMCFCLFYG